MAPHPLVGKPAPALTLPDANGETYEFVPGAEGKPVALFFYPKAGTYGCTKEACQFRDALADKPNFKDADIRVVGVSGDPVEKQKAFVEKNKLTYPVLSDHEGTARKAYQCGKSLFGDSRVTFFIDGKGNVRDALDATLNFGAHTKFVEKWLVAISKESAAPAESAPEPATEEDAKAAEGEAATA